MLIGVSVSIAPVLTKLFNMSIAAAESLYCMLPILIQWMLVEVIQVSNGLGEIRI